jgi:hypothetical protein
MKTTKSLIFATLFLLSTIGAQSQVKLTLNPKKGKKYETTTEMLQTVSVNMGGQKIPTENKSSFILTTEVIGKTKEGTVFKYAIKRMTMNVSARGENTSYDSDVEPTTPMEKQVSKFIKPLIDISFEATVTPEGKVTDIKGLSELFEGMGNNPILKSVLSEEYLKQMVAQGYGFYPKTAVKVGESWDVDQSVDVSGNKTDVNTHCTLKSVSGNMATITTTSDIAINMSLIGTSNMAGTQIGTIVIDTQTGMPVSSDIEANVNGKIAIPANLNKANTDMEVEMGMTVKNQTTTKEIK